MRGTAATANRRYHPFTLTFEPNTTGQDKFGRLKATTVVRAYGWKDALNQADRLFDLDRVRFINHPSATGVATAYQSEGTDEVVVGQVTAERA